MIIDKINKCTKSLFNLYLTVLFLSLECVNPEPVAPENGVIELTTQGVTTYGATAIIRCDDGYDMSGGPTTITCEADENWTQFTTTCKIKGKTYYTYK